VIYVIVGGAAGWLLQSILAASGGALISPTFTFAITLVLIGLVVVAFALPVRRAVRDRENHRVDPFYATRVVVLAKAASIAGSLLFGTSVAIVTYLLTRPNAAGVGSIFASGSAILGSLILLVCGLIAENMCSIPPEDKDKKPNDPATTRPR
jgi:4-hydroxybenzoate polyprenyltransferase